MYFVELVLDFRWHYQDVYLHPQWGGATNVCWDSHISSLLQLVCVLLGLVRSNRSTHTYGNIILAKVRPEGFKQCGYQSFTRGLLTTWWKQSLHTLFWRGKQLFWIQIIGVHNIDFSGVRDDKCQTGVGNDQVLIKIIFIFFLAKLRNYYRTN